MQEQIAKLLIGRTIKSVDNYSYDSKTKQHYALIEFTDNSSLKINYEVTKRTEKAGANLDIEISNCDIDGCDIEFNTTKPITHVVFEKDPWWVGAYDNSETLSIHLLNDSDEWDPNLANIDMTASYAKPNQTDGQFIGLFTEKEGDEPIELDLSFNSRFK